MNICVSQNNLLRRILPPFALLLVFFFAVGNPHFARAQSIWIEADTHILVETAPETVRIVLLDDFHRPLAHERVVASIESASGERWEYEAETDDVGTCAVHPDLEYGTYTGTVRFAGRGGYLGSTAPLRYVRVPPEAPAPEAFAGLGMATFVPLGGGLAAILVLGAILFAVSRRRPRVLPPQRAKTAVVSRVSLPNPDAPSTFVCLDARTCAEIDPGAVCATCDGRPIECREWPVTCPAPSRLEVSHDGYVPWAGNVRRAERLTVRLERRRDYAIRCFEAAATCVAGHPVEWGAESPQDLLRMAGGDANPEIAAFCALVSRAAFDTDGITVEMLDEIYARSRRIASTSPKIPSVSAAGR